MKWKAENREKREKQLAKKAQKLQQPQDAAAAAAAPAVFPPQKRRSLYVVKNPKTSKSTDIKRLPVAPSVGKAITLQPAPAAKQATGGAVKPKATTTAVKQPAPAAVKPPPPAAVKPTPGVVLKPKTATTAVTPAAPPKKPLSQPLSTKRVAAPAASALTVQKSTASVKKPLQPATATKSVPLKPSTASSAVKPHPSTATRSTRPINLMTQPFDRPANAARIVKPIRAGGAPGKFKSTAPQKSSKPLGMSDHSRIIKLKKAAPTHSKQKLMDKMPNLKKELLQIATEEPLPETPIDAESTENPFQAQATSTHCKGNSCSEDLLEAYRDLTKLSPVMCTATPKTVGSTVKRQLIPPPVEAEAEAKAESKQKPKFNFVRYSEGFSMLNSPTSPAEETVIPAAAAAGEHKRSK